MERSQTRDIKKLLSKPLGIIILTISKWTMNINQLDILTLAIIARHYII